MATDKAKKEIEAKEKQQLTKSLKAKMAQNNTTKDLDHVAMTSCTIQMFSDLHTNGTDSSKEFVGYDKVSGGSDPLESKMDGEHSKDGEDHSNPTKLKVRHLNTITFDMSTHQSSNTER